MPPADQTSDQRPDHDAARPGEQALAQDPGRLAAAAPDAGLVFIGQARTPWQPGDCPRNLRAARATGQAAWLEIAAPYRPGLEGLAAGDWLVLLYWVGRRRRDLIVQSPRHRQQPTGVFALRSPVRPNPIALAVVRCTAIDPATGRVEIDALDCYDTTPVLDIKPWLEGIDRPPG